MIVWTPEKQMIVASREDLTHAMISAKTTGVTTDVTTVIAAIIVVTAAVRIVITVATTHQETEIIAVQILAAADRTIAAAVVLV